MQAWVLICGQIINCYNEGEINGNDAIGGIIGRTDYTSNIDDKIMNCFTIGPIKGNSNLGGIMGKKAGYGTHYIEHCYWPEEMNLKCANINPGSTGKLEITNSQAYSESYLKTEEFVELLNSYVRTYNAEEANTQKLLEWKLDENIGYPTFRK